MNHFLRTMFFLFIIKPLMTIGLGINIRNRKRLPTNGPAILVANHNSHLDTMLLMSLFPLKVLKRVRPVAAKEYFMRGKLLSWFSTKIIGIVPLARTKAREDESIEQRLSGIFNALDDGGILILFPEGSRGEPEKMVELKRGIEYIAKKRPSIPITPLFLHGLGKSLPKGEFLLVPFMCDAFVGEAMTWDDFSEGFMPKLSNQFEQLKTQLSGPDWD